MSFSTKLIDLIGKADKIDEASSTVIYMGYHKPGNYNPASAVWRIIRMQQTGTVWAREFADGNDNYDNIWDNRAALSYSLLD